MIKSTNKVQPDSDDSSSPSGVTSGLSSDAKRDDQQFWRAMKKDDEIQTLYKLSSDIEPTSKTPASTALEPQSARPIELTTDMDDLSAEDRETRRKTLRSMLTVSEARQQGAIRARRPTPEAGLRVGVKNGPFKGQEGTILDADYIESRVLLDLEDGQDAQWVEFARLQSLIAD